MYYETSYLDFVIISAHNIEAIFLFSAHKIKKADDEREDHSFEHSTLHGIPVLIKDNISTKDGGHETTAGSLALLGSIPPRDAGVVKKLRDSGAIILGKTSLTEWSGARADTDEGWCPRGGRVKNPYHKDESNEGSSTGSAVSVAANLVTVSLGTETIGSIMWPCGENYVVGIKPTVGITSRSGVIPFSRRQDSIGPIARTVSDAVHLLDTIAGYDPFDQATEEARMYIPGAGYKQYLNEGGLNGKRIGNWCKLHEKDYENRPGLMALFQKLVDTMRDQGADIIEPEIHQVDYGELLSNIHTAMYNVLRYELKRDLNNYLGNLTGSNISSLSDLMIFNKNTPEERVDIYGERGFKEAQATSLPSDSFNLSMINLEASNGIFRSFMTVNNLDAIVAPEGHLSSFLAVGGCPGIIVPAGADTCDIPLGIMFGGLRGYEPRLIEIAYSFEQATKIRRPP